MHMKRDIKDQATEDYPYLKHLGIEYCDFELFADHFKKMVNLSRIDSLFGGISDIPPLPLTDETTLDNLNTYTTAGFHGILQ